MESMAGLKGKVALITGGAGFIGSHLVDKLSKLGAKVIVLDIAIDPKSYYVVNQVFKNSTFELCDIRDINQVKRVLQKHIPEYVFHLAAEPIVEKGYDSPIQTFETNIMGTINVLEAARGLKRVKGIIVASSDKAYGKTKTEYNETSALKGDHPYDVSKSAADLIAQTYFNTYDLPIAITRFGNVYGEGDVHLNRLIPGICEALVRNKTLEIRSNGRYVRDYLYVADVVNGYVFLVDKIEKIKGEAFNFSSKDNLSVIEVVKLAGKILDKKIPYKILNIAKNEIPYQHLNDTKIRKLGWKNGSTLTSTLHQVLKWYRETLF